MPPQVSCQPGRYRWSMPLPASARSLRKKTTGGRVARNVRVADMSLDVLVSDATRIEVVCNGFSLPKEPNTP